MDLYECRVTPVPNPKMNKEPCLNLMSPPFYGIKVEHLPTGMVVSVFDYRTQKQNLEKALKLLEGKI